MSAPGQAPEGEVQPVPDPDLPAESPETDEAAAFDYGEPAGLFIRRYRKPQSAAASPAGAERAWTRSAHRNAMTYRRFATGAEAIRFALEELPAEGLAATVLDVAGDRFESAAIRNLYESAAYPLPRRRSA